MKLTFDTIREIACGAVSVSESEDGFNFFRFTSEQSHMYKAFRNVEYYQKTLSTAGVRLAMRTDSERMSFDFKFAYGSSRRFGWFDIYEDGLLIDHVGDEGLLHNSGHADIRLSPGFKTVEIYFPWSKAASISEFELDDGASVVPVKRPRKLLCYGDSITHGYDAIFPSLSYANRLAVMLGADPVNKAIGGDTFFPELLALTEPVRPDIVTVAYGTNDWNVHSREVFEDHCGRFFEQLSKKFPDAKIFAITPIWRQDKDKETKFGAPLDEVEPLIRSICSGFANITVIGGMRMTPHYSEFYSDRYLHPNDLGFCHYANNLYAQISRYL